MKELVTQRDSWAGSRGPGGVQVICRQGSNSVGLRKTRFQSRQIGLRVKLGHPAVNGPGRPRVAEYVRPVTFHLSMPPRANAWQTKPSTAKRLAGPATAGPTLMCMGLAVFSYPICLQPIQLCGFSAVSRCPKRTEENPTKVSTLPD